MSGAATLIIRHGRQSPRNATAQEDENMSQGYVFAKNQVESDGGYHSKKISWIPEFDWTWRALNPHTQILLFQCLVICFKLGHLVTSATGLWSSGAKLPCNNMHE